MRAGTPPHTCGIVGLFLKNSAFEAELGFHLSGMLAHIQPQPTRWAGWGIYHPEAREGLVKLSLHHRDREYDWLTLAARFGRFTGYAPEIRRQGTHALLSLRGSEQALRDYLHAHARDVTCLSACAHLEVYKGAGSPADVIEEFGLREMSGTHGLAHGCMVKASSLTAAEAGPFSRGLDLCLAHDGSLHEYQRLRTRLRHDGFEFHTGDDSEVAAVYLGWEIQNGATLTGALQGALERLHGFGTFVVGTRECLAVLRDGTDCEHFALAETDDYVALAAHPKALGELPGIEQAHLWHPRPGSVYCWSREPEPLAADEEEPEYLVVS